MFANILVIGCQQVVVFAQRLEATGDTQEAIKQLENLLSVGNPS